MTVTPTINDLSSRHGQSQEHETEIVSSLMEQWADVDHQSASRQKRRAIIVTVISTITTFTLTTTSLTKSFTLVPTYAAVLSCLPMGYTVC
jgi:accessory gene regulator protein AgrB